MKARSVFNFPSLIVCRIHPEKRPCQNMVNPRQITVNPRQNTVNPCQNTVNQFHSQCDLFFTFFGCGGKKPKKRRWPKKRRPRRKNVDQAKKWSTVTDVVVWRSGINGHDWLQPRRNLKRSKYESSTSKSTFGWWGWWFGIWPSPFLLCDWQSLGQTHGVRLQFSSACSSQRESTGLNSDPSKGCS